MSPRTSEIPFEVEGSFEAQGKAYVLARILRKGENFALTERSALDGYPLEQRLEIPRALGMDGKQRYDLFAFCLKNVSDRSYFTERRRVTLTS